MRSDSSHAVVEVHNIEPSACLEIVSKQHALGNLDLLDLQDSHIEALVQFPRVLLLSNWLSVELIEVLGSQNTQRHGTLAALRCLHLQHGQGLVQRIGHLGDQGHLGLLDVGAFLHANLGLEKSMGLRIGSDHLEKQEALVEAAQGVDELFIEVRVVEVLADSEAGVAGIDDFVEDVVVRFPTQLLLLLTRPRRHRDLLKSLPHRLSQGGHLRHPGPVVHVGIGQIIVFSDFLPEPLRHHLPGVLRVLLLHPRRESCLLRKIRRSVFLFGWTLLVI